MARSFFGADLVFISSTLLDRLPDWALLDLFGGLLVVLGALVALVAVLPGGRRLSEWTGQLRLPHRIFGVVLGLVVGGVGVAYFVMSSSSGEGAADRSGLEEALEENGDPSQDDPEQDDPEQDDPEREDPEREDPEREDPEREDPEQDRTEQDDSEEGPDQVTEPEPAAPSLIGSVHTGHLEALLPELHRNYHFRWGNSVGVRGPVDKFGRFSLGPAAGRAASESVAWYWEEPSEFVIWPLRWEPDAAGNQPVFHLEKVWDVFDRSVADMREYVGKGDFEAANRMLSELTILFQKFYTVQREDEEHTLRSRIRRLHYSAYREVAFAAGEYRTRMGTSEVDLPRLGLERQWRRGSIVAAADQGGTAAGTDLAFAMNEFAAFSRRAYRPFQRAWPDRAIGSCNQLLRREISCEWISEDVLLILEHLRSSPVAELIDAVAGSRGAGLSGEQRDALDRFKRRGSSTTLKNVRLSRLVEVLSALMSLAEAVRADGDRRSESARQDVVSVGGGR